MSSRKVCVALLAALGACTADDPRASDTTTGGTNGDPGDVAGNQSGTEGHAACSCNLGEPREEVALDGAQCGNYPFAYTPNEIFDVLEGVHTFSCPRFGITASVEIVRGAGARILEGVVPSDTEGGDEGPCTGLELDATLRLHASNGLTFSANKLRYGGQCEIRYRTTLISVASGEVQAALAGEQVPAEVMLWDADTLLLKHGKEGYDHCTRIIASDGADAGPATTHE